VVSTDATVRQVLADWIKNKSGSVASPTLVAYKQAAKLFITFLGSRANKSIGQITKRDAVEFRD